MAPDPTPLHEVAVQFGQLGTIFYNLSKAVEKIVWIGPWLAQPFYWAYERCYWAAHYISKADERFESLSWDDFIDSFEGWAMKLLGADWWDFWVLGKNLFRFFLHRVGLSHLEAINASGDFSGWLKGKVKGWWGYLDALRDDPAGWIKGKIATAFPALEHLFDSPVRWVLYMLGVPWGDTITWQNHLFGWLLYLSGESRLDSLWWDRYPKYWIWAKTLGRWAFLDDILADAVGWTWAQWKKSIDKYLDTQLKWVKDTGEGILYKLWDMEV